VTGHGRRAAGEIVSDARGTAAHVATARRHRAPSPAEFIACLKQAPCCAAIVAEEHLEAAIASRAPILFILRGNGLELSPVVRRIHEAGKLVAVHLDLVAGLRDDPVGVSWLARADVDAIITSRGRLIPLIRQEGIVAIERLLLSRRSHLDSAITALSRSSPDVVEVLPGVILPSIAHMIPRFAVPVLAGGFVRTPADVRAILGAGAVGVTTSAQALWELNEGP
jgi:glycerol uptake operon antiterminator